MGCCHFQIQGIFFWIFFNLKMVSSGNEERTNEISVELAQIQVELENLKTSSRLQIEQLNQEISLVFRRNSVEIQLQESEKDQKTEIERLKKDLNLHSSALKKMKLDSESKMYKKDKEIEKLEFDLNETRLEVNFAEIWVKFRSNRRL